MIDGQYPFFDALGGTFLAGRRVLNACGITGGSGQSKLPGFDKLLRPLPRKPDAPSPNIRAKELSQMLGIVTRRKVIIGVGDVVNPETGEIYRLVSSSELDRSIANRINSQEFVKNNEYIVPSQVGTHSDATGHAEDNIVRYAQQQGWNVLSVGASGRICSECRSTIESAGGTPVGSLR